MAWSTSTSETQTQTRRWANGTPQSGALKLLVNDTWWDNRAVDQWTGQPRNWTFYWVLVPAGMVLNGSEAHQPTFTVVQTALPNYAISSSPSMSSAPMNGFPTWAIALVVVLGVVTFTFILSLAYVLQRYSRRKQEDRRTLMELSRP